MSAATARRYLKDDKTVIVQRTPFTTQLKVVTGKNKSKFLFLDVPEFRPLGDSYPLKVNQKQAAAPQQQLLQQQLLQQQLPQQLRQHQQPQGQKPQKGKRLKGSLGTTRSPSEHRTTKGLPSYQQTCKSIYQQKLTRCDSSKG